MLVDLKTQVEEFLVSTVRLRSMLAFSAERPFETMVFYDNQYHDVLCQRYVAEADARAGHEALVERMRNDEGFLEELRARKRVE